MSSSIKYALLSFSLLLPLHWAVAQTLRGTVRDAVTGEALIGANVSLAASAESTPITTQSNAAGEYLFQSLRPGYYTLTVTHGGYRPMTIREISVAGGKETRLDINYDQNMDLPQLTVVNAAARRPLQPLGAIPLTREQTLRFPATFFDPARLAMAYPGVMNNDDQANGLSVRGNSPAFMRWRLEGVDVVNPNHLTNAGTISDRPTAAAGGVLMFSAQLLDNSSLLTGSFPAGYGEALGGIMDINLRSGNTRQHEFTAQAGLIGFDIAAEGPLLQRGKNSYLFNYRYSTVGLLGQMGIPFGDEQIDFQDLSFKFNFQGKNGGEWSLFGLGGLSNNMFEHKSDSTAIKEFKDFFDVDYQSKTGVVGLSNWSPLGKKGWVKVAFAASAQSNARTSFSEQYAEYDSYDYVDESKLSGSITLSQRLHSQWRIMGGAMLTQQQYRYEALLNTMPQVIPDHRYFIAQPWANATWNSRNEKTSVQFGAHSVAFPYKNRHTIEPRLTLTHQLAPNHRLALSGGRYSSIAPLWLLKDDIDLIRAWHTGLKHTWSLVPNWVLKTEVFWQRQTDVGVDANVPTSFSLLNENEYRIFSQKEFAYRGAGENRGLELTAERYFSGGWFVLANATFLKSAYQGSDGAWRTTRWHARYIVNVTGGKEWHRDKRPGQVRAFGLNGRFTWTDGVRSLPVDAAASAQAGYTVFDESAGFAANPRDYLRLDLRAYWKRSLGDRRNSTFAMDFQNALMQENVAYQYWDPYKQSVETKYQLGLIPNLSWRLEF
ncbi:MAG: TonB-dependent receptor [Saprospiraceae bacterium]|nr:TonB-dependent receptor [Saprospiraceae bacterium]